MTFKALSLTILVSVFFILGIILPKFFKNKNKLILFTMGLSFIILLFLSFMDLIPEITEVLLFKYTYKYIPIAIIFVILGFVVLKILDFYIPEHKHDHQEKNDNVLEHNNHLFHIGFITSLSLIIHNLLEGISIYITSLANFKLGLIMALTVGCHNLPLGMEISISMDAIKDKKLIKIILIFLVVLSSFMGAFILFIIGKNINFLIEGIFLCITLGMIFYLLFLEILPELIKHNKESMLKLGIICGIVLSLVLAFF